MEENLIKIENILATNEPIKVEDKTFKKVMFIYSVEIKELTNKL